MDAFWFYTFFIIGIGFALLVGWFGMGCLITYRCNRKAVQASQLWHENKARVVLSKADAEPYYDQDTYNLTFFPRVHYVYKVDGQEYEGKRIRFGEPNYGLFNQPGKVLAKYRSGCEVGVYYDPLCPEESVLERVAFIPGVYLVLGIGLLLMMAMILGVITYWWVFDTQEVLSYFSM